MSLLSRDSYTFLLAPSALTLTKRRLGIVGHKLFGHKVISRQHVECPVATKSPSWQAPLAALDNCLAGLNAGARVHVELSNHFMRYHIIPAMPPFSRAEQLLAVASHCFREVYGDMVEQWTLQVNPLPHGDSVLACATDTALLAGIAALGSKYSLRLSSIQPYLMSGFNASRRRFRSVAGKASQPACFVQLETKRATMLLMRDQALHAVASCALSNHPASASWTHEVAALVSREMVFAGWQDEQPTLYIASSFASNFSSDLFMESADFNRTLPPGTRWDVVMLPAAVATAAAFGSLATQGQQA